MASIKLILGPQLLHEKLTILRAYAKYLRQIGLRFTQPYIEKSLSHNTAITKDLIALFKAKHSPKKSKDIDSVEACLARIKSALKMS